MTWGTGTLEELCNIQIGRTPSRSNPELWGEGEPWLSIADMKQGRLIRTTKEQITEAGAAAGRRIPIGTVLLSFKLSIGKVAISGVPLFTNEAIAALPIKNPKVITAPFLAEALRTLNLAGGANQAAKGATLNKEKLKRVQIPLPSPEEQASIVEKFEMVANLRGTHERGIDFVDELTAALQTELLGPQ